MKTIKYLVAAAAISMMTVANAKATMIVLFEEVGGHVVVNSNGTIDLAGLPPIVGASGSARVVPLFPTFISGGGGLGVIPGAFSIDLPGFGASSIATFASSTSGDRFGLADAGTTGSLLVPRFYVSGAPINSTSVYLNQSFASLGLDEVPQVYTLTNGDTVEVYYDEIPTPEVPLPLSGILLATGIGGLIARRLIA